MKKLFNKMWNTIYMIFVYGTFLGAFVFFIVSLYSMFTDDIQITATYLFISVACTFIYKMLKGSD